MADAMTLGLKAGYEVADLGSISAPGVTSSELTTGLDLAFQVTVSSIGTSVTIRLEGSIDGDDYFNLDESETDTVLTANGTYGYALSGCPIQYARLRLVSIDGGSPSIAAKIGSM
jgi:hypothetical protein